MSKIAIPYLRINSTSKMVMPLLMIVVCLSSFAVAEGKSAKVMPERLRGAVSGVEHVTPGIVKWMADQGANFVMLNVPKDEKGKWDDPERGFRGVEPTKDDPLKPYQQNLDSLDKILPSLRENGMVAVVACGKFWGRSKIDFWDREKGKEAREHVVQFWRAMARRYRDEPAIVAFDVMGEPSWRYDQEMHLTEILPSFVASIRSEDPDVWISVQPGPGIGPQAIADIKPFDDPHILYCFHHYTPLAYTHQGIKNSVATRGKYTYPGMAPMTSSPEDDRPATMWNKDALRENMKPAIDFKRKHNVRILVGEFSVIRWAPGGAQYLADSIEIFEEEGFDWSYHAVAGWDGWNLTVAPDAEPVKELGAPKDTGAPTDRLDVVLAGWSKNNPKGNAR